MKLARVVLLSLMVLALGCAAASTPERPNPDVELAWSAVKDLKHPNYERREQARTTLLTLGRPSIEPLEHAQLDDDPEVALRAAELLIALRGRGFLGVGLPPAVDMDFDGMIDSVEGQGSVFVTHVVSRAQMGLRDDVRPLPAEAAGLQQNDKLLAINGRPVRGTRDLIREIVVVGPARTAEVTIERNGQVQRLPVVLARNPTPPGASYGLVNTPLEELVPVDLEKELEDQEKGKPAAVPAPAPKTPAAETRVEVKK